MAPEKIDKYSDKEKLRSEMEEVLSDFVQEGDGRLCGKDAGKALSVLREAGFYKYGDQVILIRGPLEHYSYKFKGIVKERHHMVGQIKKEWVVDVACKPGSRVYFDMNDYMENSGIKILS